jgi:glutaminyl-tRNA synthetase
MSKRKLMLLVQEKYVMGWDDPRMPTISGLRRRGYSPESIRNFAETVGVAKRENIIDVNLLEFCAREHLNKVAQRRMAVLDPVKLIIDNYPDAQVELMNAVNNPEDPDSGTRQVHFSKELWIERADFKEDADKKFFRLTIGGEVRLKYAYIIKCTHIVKDKEGKITEIHATYDPETKSGMEQSNRKVKATIHWLSVDHAQKAEVRLFDKLFTVPEPDNTEEGKTFLDYINPNSLVIIDGFVEETMSLENKHPYYQFERTGYFCLDKDSNNQKLVFNKTVGLKS